MNVLVIYTYPNHESLSHAFLEKVIKGSNENPNIKGLQVLDLYEEGFNPLLEFNEHKRRRDMHRDPQLEKYRNQITFIRQDCLCLSNLVGEASGNANGIH